MERSDFDWFFGERAVRRRVFLSLDEKALVDIAAERGWDLPDAVRDFEVALRIYVAPRRNRPFRLWAETADR